MTPRHNQPGPDDMPLFEVAAPAPEVTPADLGAMATRIAAAAALNSPDLEKPLSPAYADLGYQRSEGATLAANPPRTSSPKRARPASTSRQESRYTDIGSDTADSDPSGQSMAQVTEARQNYTAMPDEARLARDGYAQNAAAIRRARRTGAPIPPKPAK